MSETQADHDMGWKLKKETEEEAYLNEIERRQKQARQTKVEQTKPVTQMPEVEKRHEIVEPTVDYGNTLAD